MIRLIAALVTLLLLAGCGQALSSLATGPKAVVEQVRSGDVAVLRGGQVVRLAGVEAPRAGEPYADAARTALTRLVLGQEVQLMFGGARQDAFGRTLAHLRLTHGGAWVEQRLLLQGDARVRTYADNRALARPMLDDEARARRARRGLWALPAYAVRLPDEAAARPFGFQLVEGRVVAVSEARGGVRLDLERWVEAEVPRTAEDAFTAAGAPIETLAGKLVRVRGVLHPGSGEALMQLDHPEQIEVLRER